LDREGKKLFYLEFAMDGGGFSQEKNGTESAFSLDRSIIALLYIKQKHVKI
jgi:hypothetical protein